MKGNNELQLNEATMIAAVQLYLDSLMNTPGAVCVTSVKPNNSNGAYATRDTFTVSVRGGELTP